MDDARAHLGDLGLPLFPSVPQGECLGLGGLVYPGHPCLLSALNRLDPLAVQGSHHHLGNKSSVSMHVRAWLWHPSFKCLLLLSSSTFRSREARCTRATWVSNRSRGSHHSHIPLWTWCEGEEGREQILVHAHQYPSMQVLKFGNTLK